jgi:hypothetical protein
MMRCMLLLLAAVLCQIEMDSAEAWSYASPFRLPQRLGNRRSKSSPFALAMVESLSLESLSDNHEAVGQELADSLQRMLDAEWMPQEVHVRMAASVKQSYVTCRLAGDSDLMSIMTVTADDLTAKWKEYDADAFVNAWDISNYVSDFLASKTGSRGCECTQKIY